MKRICLMGAALAGLFTAGITTAASAAPAKFKTVTKTVIETQTKLQAKTVRSHVSCKPDLLVQVPAGSTTIIQGSETGSMFGSAGCGTPVFRGVSRLSYTQDTGGDLTGPFQQWFNTGTLFGTFTLTPAPTTGPPTTTSFTQQSYAGTIKFTGGTEALRKRERSGQAELRHHGRGPLQLHGDRDADPDDRGRGQGEGPGQGQGQGQDPGLSRA